MTNLYEYKHPIINTDLATSGVDSSPRKFTTLEAWQDVINDYEFQARCPIILKNSHRNKHFTFACHLKGCPFKILLSHSNSTDYYSNENNSPNNGGHSLLNEPTGDHDIDAVKQDSNVLNHSDMVGLDGKGADNESSNSNVKPDETDDLINVKNDDDDSASNNNNNDDAVHERKYSESDAADPNVTAAIAAAVAAVQNPGLNQSKDGDDLHKEKDNTDQDSKDKDKSNQFDVNEMLIQHANGESVIPGPFVVTKIEPYHNHSLEENLSLDRFVLTKIPKILQYDLNFDNTLEDIYQKSNHSLTKFKVSQFVEESGLLEIVKHRYHLVDEDITKKFISLISRRVTTYKARFVLKKKKIGEYRNIGADSFLNHGHEDNVNNEKITEDILLHNNDHNVNLNQSNHEQSNMNVEHQISQENDTSLTRVSDDHNNRNENATQDIRGHLNEADEKEVRAAAQAAMGEAINMKRQLEDVENVEDLDRFNSNKRSKLDQALKNAALDDNALVALDEIPDDKLPHDVAEQLRLLSSHFKEVEATSLQNQSVDNDQDINNDNDDDSNKLKNDDISDENIQPELRGQ